MTVTVGPSDHPEPIETTSADELRSLQLERLRWSLRHAYENVPHYHAAFDAIAVHPDDCKELADLAKFPFTAKADLRENYPFGMFAVPREQVVRVHDSSGTTGRATVVGYTRDDIDTWATVMARSIRAAGGRPGQPNSLLKRGVSNRRGGGRSFLCRAVVISGVAPGTTCGNHRANYPRHHRTPSGMVFAVQMHEPVRKAGGNPDLFSSYKRGAGGSNPAALTRFLQLDGVFKTPIGDPGSHGREPPVHAP